MIISPKAAKRIVLAVFVVPLLIYVFLFNFSKPVRDRVPFVYKVEAGDSSIRTLPEFSLYNLKGEEVQTSDLLGNICFVSFFSLAEDTLSQVLYGNLRRTYKNLDWERKPSVRFINISTGDSLSSLQTDQAKHKELDSRYWITLQGTDSVIYQLAGESLDLPEFRGKSEGPYRITSQYVCMIDKEGRLRRYFIGTDLGHERKMQEDIIALIRMEYPEELGK